MPISRDEVTRIAHLARLRIEEADLDRTAGELSAVLDFAAALDRLDLEGCEPTSFAPADAALRDDVPDGRRLSADAALAASPDRERDFFLVPPVVENLNP
ncbi:MAG TPA: Asp-tRNA(Asn)/Glu-tRNA(Gln) amidotransferase subunit GatC [Candidatus Eisenbacteria bacterium]|jgi:aspartyl-tRNA(Asn)/glutamyl-tRNA(Gln) amidotransferase subunit C